MPDRTLTVFRSAPAGDRPEIAGWKIVSVVLGEQVDLPEAASMLTARMEGRDCLVATSPRAAAWLARQILTPTSRPPVFVAGASTGAALKENGWDVRIPEGTGGAAAVELLATQGYSHPLFVGARDTAGTVEETSERLELDLDHLAVYTTIPRGDLTESDIAKAATEGPFAFLAPSAVAILRTKAPRLFATISATSAAVAAGSATRHALEESGWRDIRTAPGPDFRSLTASLEWRNHEFQ